MDTSKLKKFAQSARRTLMGEVASKINQVLAEGSAARRENPEAVRTLQEAIKEQGREQVEERVAYTWFNRFCALRFMDVNHYSHIRIVSPADGQHQPEILAEAKMGHMDEDLIPEKIRVQISDLLNGRAVSPDPQGEAYRMMVVAVCNYWNASMPFMFQRINDYTELLMPDALLAENSILHQTREALTPEICEDVEVIGWLYQFYISEKKDQVFEGLKKNKKITPENIPAATQLFTPHWIVKYLVENSLGRLWMLNRPDSRLVEKMAYYIKETVGSGEWEVESENSSSRTFLKISSPEEIKICDPACGSGHMLTYAFDLLYAIYEEEGYEPSRIPGLILSNNLYGIEIDERAGNLASFALTMKARSHYRRFFKNIVSPNICVLENVDLSLEKRTTNEHEWTQILNAMCSAGVDQEALTHDLTLFSEADNFGSLLRTQLPPDQIQKAVDALMAYNESVRAPGFGFRELVHQCKKALNQADYLSQKYHVVIANPPYMGGKGMNGRLGAWLKDNYGDVKSDLFSAFMVRNTELALPKGQLGFMTPFVWMFISSYEKLRNFLISQKTITSLVQLEYSGFDGATVPICTFTIENEHQPDFKGGYVRLSDFRGSENQGPKTMEAIQNPECGWFFRASAEKFKVIPSSPIAYWVSEIFVNPFKVASETIHDLTISDGQTKTGDNDKYLRQSWEVASSTVGPNAKWWQHPKGGPYRKWFGNVDWVIDWSETARKHYQKDHVARILPEYLWGKRGISWTLITSNESSFRTLEANQIFNLAAPSLFFHDEKNIEKCLGFLNTKYVTKLLKVINPTLNMNVGEVRCLPLLYDINSRKGEINRTVRHCVTVSKADWNSYETSWDFTILPLFHPDYRQSTIKASYQKLRSHWKEMTLEMQRLEEENNRIFIEAYGLQDELTPEVPLNEITLTCNPYYRYNRKQTTENTEHTEKEQNKDFPSVCSVYSVVKKDFPIDHELEKQLLADTMKELISYAVGCMFGRYALEKPGLILANQGETIEDYYRKLQEPQIDTNEHEGKDKKNIGVDLCSFVVQPSFPADDDNVIPMLDGNWFTDDIVDRFKKFIQVAFGEEHYEENLRFVEKALGKDIRKYFLRDFYADHVKRYKKRPIYWLFSSPKGSFNALIYMHRYRHDTVSIVLNEYLREFRTKLDAQKKHLEAISIRSDTPQAEKTKALKEIAKTAKMISELEAYERDILYPLATQQIKIDLDDGVKVNYPRFGAALKKIPGLDTKGD
ncbi:BREX-1 system adenine-specific DNA-methyltransferase PglX [Desulfobotulus mexicanus]|uniref:site-specific DNA-methyltransferase (adenine-specific) n=1 Tax=Desulfobotulus mexicanus TaxID=2586642 RepID=A0A5Q4VF41_9BACT|nr:BREX-1 system adenine-specific DNA-methyltransferase PglX [Desulfobotulus mexicanus]TYT75598.1 BREX-1 system adenine-specific DNA-methyltransferase PglX [Desulfobotulus mexicanus]